MGARFQNKVFNVAVDRVELANKQLIEVYTKAAKSTEAKIARLKVQIDKGLFAEARADRLLRMEALLKDITTDLITLKNQEAIIIVEGFTDTFQNGYYGYGYDISKDVNTRILKNVSFDYSLGYRKLNVPYIRSVYVDELASNVFGLGIKSWTQKEVIRIQSSIRQEVAQAIIEGTSPRKVASNLANIDVIFEQNLNHAFTVSRTEILRGHSFGSQEAIATSEDAGVQGVSVWNATLDGETRQTHRDMDSDSRAGIQPDENGFFNFPDGSSTEVPRGVGLSVGETVNCRCNKEFRPFGVSPNKRGQRLADGSWVVKNGDIGYNDWAKTLDGKRSIEASAEYRRRRAGRLARLRAKDKKRPVIENVKARLESLKK